MSANARLCPSCYGDLRDPRQLPCRHQFCVACLQQYCQYKRPGDETHCQVCWTKFQIPDSGVAHLPLATDSGAGSEEQQSARELNQLRDELMQLRHNQLQQQTTPAHHRATPVVQQLSAGGCIIRGITSVDDELFVLLHVEPCVERKHKIVVVKQVAVYSLDDYRLLRHITVPHFEPHDRSDMTSCAQRRRLYLSDYDNQCVHVHDFRDEATPWGEWKIQLRDSTDELAPCALSVTSDCNLLVVCHVCKARRGGPVHCDRLIELSGDNGQVVRQIALPPDMAFPSHGVQLTTGQFVVCQRGRRRAGEQLSSDQVCVVSGGKAIHQYGEGCGSDVGQLEAPSYAAVDSDNVGGRVYVADTCNDRLVVLTAQLQFIAYTTQRMSEPSRLYLHHASRRLFVSHWHLGGLTVIQL